MKYVVDKIKQCKVIGVYDAFDEAYKKTVKTEEVGTFLNFVLTFEGFVGILVINQDLTIFVICIIIDSEFDLYNIEMRVYL